jgi:hypothetical protein
MLQRLARRGARRFGFALHETCGELQSGTPGADLTVIDSRDEAPDPRLHAGVYRGTRLHALNRPMSEDRPQTLADTEVRELFGPLTLRMLQDRQGTVDKLQSEMWRLFLFSVLLALLVESLLILPAAGEVRAAAEGAV